MIPLLDLNAPIVPGVGLAGLKVGVRLERYRDLLNAAHDQYDGGWDGESPDWCGFWMEPWAVRYRLGQVYDQTDAEFLAMTGRVLEGDLEGSLHYLESPEPELDPAVEVYAPKLTTRGALAF